MRVWENIGLGNLDKLDDRPSVQNAAVLSGATGVVSRLQQGFDQMLGTMFRNGVNLSGGEWQKLALARTYMREASLIILDEPTAALDAQAEQRVFRQFIDLTEAKSALIISHRFSTVRMADRIVVLQNGEIHEEGTHDELIGRKGLYSELFDLQAAGYR